MRLFGGSGQPLSTYGQPNEVTLQAGECYYFNSNANPSVPGQGTGNAGWYIANVGRYSNLQFYDPISTIWRSIGDDTNAQRMAYSDGSQYRIANQTGCVVATTVTNAGTGYTSVPTVVAGAGSPKLTAVLGPLVSTTATVTYGGTNYLYPPAVIIQPPPAGGLCATATCGLTGGAVSTITIVNQGAGYSGGTPLLWFVNDPRDTAGSGAVGTVTLTGAATVAAVIVTDHGNPITSGTVPTLTFSGGGGASAAATALMNWGITATSITTPGAGYATSAMVRFTAVGPALVTGAAYTNPDYSDALVRVREAVLWVPTGASTGPLTTPTQIVDAGVYRGVPTSGIISSSTAPTTVGVLGLTMGGTSDSVVLQPA